MVGAITTLIVIVAVFLAYNANNGLPFVPTYQVSVEIPNASRLVRNNEVRIGGNRVGVVESITAVRQASPRSRRRAAMPTRAAATSGEVVARLDLKLDKSVEPLPAELVFRVRYRSSFGLKYLDITRGDGPPRRRGLHLHGTDDNDDPDDDDETILSLEEVEMNEGGRQRHLHRADRVRRHRQHLRPADAQRRPPEPGRLRRRVRGPRRRR